MWRLAFVVIVWVLAGCHFVKGYVIANLDSLAAKQLDEYFDLDEAQYDLYEMKIKNQLALVQKNQIPRVIAELEVLKNKDGAIPSQQIPQWVHDKPRQIWLEIVDQVSIDAAMFLQGLKPAQRTHFESKLKERQEPRQQNNLLRLAVRRASLYVRRGRHKCLGTVSNRNKADVLHFCHKLTLTLCRFLGYPFPCNSLIPNVGFHATICHSAISTTHRPPTTRRRFALF